jgi:hypothetical protein
MTEDIPSMLALVALARNEEIPAEESTCSMLSVDDLLDGELYQACPFVPLAAAAA